MASSIFASGGRVAIIDRYDEHLRTEGAHSLSGNLQAGGIAPGKV